MNPSKHIWLLLFGLTVLMLAGCRPKGILHSWEMRSVMVDLHKMDAMLQVSGLYRGHEEAKTAYYALVLEQHGITQAQFDSSLVWYTAHPQLFDKIYPKVIKQLQTEREDFETLYAVELHIESAGGAVSSGTSSGVSVSQPAPCSREYMDSLIWVMGHGYPTLWHPYQPSSACSPASPLLP